MNIKQLEEIRKHLDEIEKLIETDLHRSISVGEKFNEFLKSVNDELRNEVWNNYVNPEKESPVPTQTKKR